MALVPESVKKLVKAGAQVTVEAGAGVEARFPDSEYQEAGATLEGSAAAAWESADLVVKVHPPDVGNEASRARSGCILLGSLMPTRHAAAMQALAARNITAFSTDCIPRITRAQSMDTLSSQATIAGYKGVIIAADELGKLFPMLMTAAGTLMSAKVFVIGAGVAGLQAIATAKRLGATVEATDTRYAVKEQVESVGGKFVSVPGAEDAQDERGYAKELSRDFYDKQAQLIAERCAANDVVITTALIGGVKAPKLISEDAVRRMKPGSVLIDLAADGGGNCAVSEVGKTIVKHGVTICAPVNLPARVPVHASLMFSRNLTTFMLAFWKDNAFRIDLEDEIQKDCVVTHGGQIVHAATKSAVGAG